MEDAAIAYGFNNLKKTFPTTNTVAQPLEVAKLSDLVRREWAFAGWVEVLPLILVSYPHLRHLRLLISIDVPLSSARMKKTSLG